MMQKVNSCVIHQINQEMPFFPKPKPQTSSLPCVRGASYFVAAKMAATMRYNNIIMVGSLHEWGIEVPKSRGAVWKSAVCLPFARASGRLVIPSLNFDFTESSRWRVRCHGWWDRVCSHWQMTGGTQKGMGKPHTNTHLPANEKVEDTKWSRTTHRTEAHFCNRWQRRNKMAKGQHPEQSMHDSEL
jgi:hypothetical protein